MPNQAKLNPRKLHPVLRRQLERHIEIDGITIDPLADFDTLSTLNRLEHAVTDPSLASDPLRELDVGIQCGNVTMRQLSLGARWWLQEHIPYWFSDNQDLRDVAHLYACAEGRGVNLYEQMPTEKIARKVLTKWVRRVNAAPDALTDAFRALHVDDCAVLDGDENGPSAPDYGRVIASLQRSFGKDPDWWMWTASLDHIRSCLEHIAMERWEKMAATYQAAGQKPPVCNIDPYIKSVNRCRRVRIAWRDRKLREVADNG